MHQLANPNGQPKHMHTHMHTHAHIHIQGGEEERKEETCMNDKGEASLGEVAAREAITRCQWTAQFHQKSSRDRV